MRAAITADVFEEESGIPAQLAELGASVELRRFEAGDYLVGPETLVERKTVLDLHGSLCVGRFWNQIGGVRKNCRYPFLAVEGKSLDAGPVGRSAIRGVCLSTLRLGVRLLRTEDASDTALWLYHLSVQSQRDGRRDRPVYAQQRQSAEVPEAMLAAVPGISVASARALLARFGSVAGVVAASPEALEEVPGIGPKRALRLAEAVATIANS